MGTIQVQVDIATKSFDTNGDFGYLCNPTTHEKCSPYVIDVEESTTFNLEAALKATYGESVVFNGWYVTYKLSSTSIYNVVFSNSLTTTYTLGPRETYAAADYKITITADCRYRDVYLKSVTVKPNNDTYGYINHGGGSFKYLSTVPVYATPYNGYKLYRYSVSYDVDTSEGHVEYYVYDSSFNFTISDLSMRNIVIVAYFRRISTSSSDWNIESTSVSIGSNLVVGMSSNVYQAGCVCKWRLRIYDNENSRYVYYGDSDWLSELWGTASYTTPTYSPPTYINLPITNRFIELINAYSSGSNSLPCTLELSVDVSNCQTLSNVYDITNNNIKDLSITVDTVSYGLQFTGETGILYDVTSRFNYDGQHSQNGPLVAGWSRFKGTYVVKSAIQQQDIKGYVKGLSAEVTYSYPQAPYYSNGSDFVWDDTLQEPAGSGSIGGVNFVTFKANPTYVQNHTVTVNVDNSLGGINTTTLTGEQIYGWREPVYELLNIYRCAEDGTIADRLEDNTCIFFRFRVDCSEMVIDNIDQNAIRLVTDPVTGQQYATNDYLVIKINDELADYDHIWSDGVESFHVIIGKNAPLNVNSDYTLTVKYRDNVTKYFKGSSLLEKDYYTSYQRVNSGMPLSLYQDDFNNVSVGVGVVAQTAGKVTLGTDGVLDNNITITGSKSVYDDVGQVTRVVTAQAPAYDLIYRGGQNSVAVSDEDLDLGKYVHNIRLISESEYKALQEKDQHTMYIILG